MQAGERDQPRSPGPSHRFIRRAEWLSLLIVSIGSIKGDQDVRITPRHEDRQAPDPPRITNYF
jgi:hypothetical protein